MITSLAGYIRPAAVLLALSILAVDTTTGAAKEQKCCVYVLLGLTNVFSLGLNKIARDLRKNGIDAKVYNHLSWRGLATSLKSRNKKTAKQNIVIVGHSAGANAGALLANKLADARVDVQLLVLVDPTRNFMISEKTKTTVNYYLPPVGKTMTNGGSNSVRNIDVRKFDGVNHFNIDDLAVIRQMVLKDIQRAMR